MIGVWTLAIALLAAAMRADASADAVAAQAIASTPEQQVIPPDVVGRLGVTTAAAAQQRVSRDVQIVGTVVVDPDRTAIVGPRLDGRVLSVLVKPGQRVTRGTLLAEIESVELARAAADYLGNRARARAAAQDAARERDLAAKRVSSAREREAAEAEAQALAAQAEASEMLLLALGLAKDELPQPGGARSLSRYGLRAPIDGVVVRRDAVPGQAVVAGATLFEVTDLSVVWVQLDVFERDLAWVKPGLTATLANQVYPEVSDAATVGYIAPEIDRETRTARVYLEVQNPDGRLLPGKFVTASLRSPDPNGGETATVVPRAALQTIDGEPVVFVKRPDGGFVVRHVRLGSQGSDVAEIADGLADGEQVAVTNAFLLKSEVLR